ncbi:MAG: S1C family serine protease [Chloroflexota bacterium]
MKAKLIFLLVFTSLSFIGCRGQDKPQDSELAKGINYSLNNEITKDRQNAITNAVQKCSPAIVGINVTETRQVVYRDPWGEFFQDDPFFRRFFGERSQPRMQKYEVKALGSGFLISPDGYILTNHHVAGNATKVIVTMTDGKEYPASIVGADQVADVALLKIEGKNLPYLKLSNSDNVIIGEWAIAFGNPFGLFDINAKPTVTVGVISNKDIDFVHEDEPYNRVYKRMIQTDAAISSGNSGGPLVNSAGDVIGMNTVIFSTSQSQQGAGSIGIGFAIPINRVRDILDKIKGQKGIDRNYYTGMEVREIDEQLARYLKLSEDARGVVIYSIQRNSPADEAGLEPGDIIESIDGSKIVRGQDYLVAIGDAVTGQKLKFVVSRDGSEKTFTVTLAPPPTKTR